MSSPHDTAGPPPSLKIVPTIYPTSPPVEEQLDSFWEAGPELASVAAQIGPPATPLALLEMLGPSPFERGGFPLIGFLATTYDKVSRYALGRP
ncbi:MAG: hypothetical protein HY763_15275 [Planctomycetes bacterium]|nr:hypothetical protein [Planctomycetota bacterium]